MHTSKDTTHSKDQWRQQDLNQTQCIIFLKSQAIHNNFKQIYGIYKWATAWNLIMTYVNNKDIYISLYSWFLKLMHLSCLMTKPTKWRVHPAKTQISLGICPVWSESWLSVWSKFGSLSYPLSAQRSLWSDWADAQADQSLRWAHTHFVGFVMSRLNSKGIWRLSWLVGVIRSWNVTRHDLCFGF